MKNVFIIASHTSFLSALGTKDYLHLSDDDVIILTMRNYHNVVIKPNCTVIDVTDIMESGKMLSQGRKKRKECIRMIDSFIADVVGEQYVLYCPHMASRIWQLFYTNPLCSKMSYIQEGGVPFKSAYAVSPNFRQRFYFYRDKILNHSHRFWGGYFWYYKGILSKQNDIDSYAISDDFFKYLPSNNHIIKWPFVNIHLDIKKNATIFVFDGYVKNGLVESNYYLNACKKLIEQKYVQVNYIKFHPAQSDDEKNRILSFFKKDVTVQVLPDDIPFELIISSYNKLNVVGFTSSLLYFAKEYGHNVYSGESLLMDSPAFVKFRHNYF